MFVESEGEDRIEANLSFLIAVMGGSLYDIYVERIINPQLQDIEIQVKAVSSPTSETNLYGLKHPTIFYGSNKRTGTHFTCAVDDKKLWNSYNEGIQIRHSDHFCQTFALMKMCNYFLPHSYIGKKYTELKRGEFLDNAIIAKEVACYVMTEILNDPDIFYENDDIYHYFDIETPEHKFNPHYLKKIEDPDFFYNHPQWIKKFINYCRNITENDICSGSFKQKIYLL